MDAELRADLIRRLNELRDLCYDDAPRHELADGVLIEALVTLGERDIASAWLEVPKTYE